MGDHDAKCIACNRLTTPWQDETLSPKCEWCLGICIPESMYAPIPSFLFFERGDQKW